MEGIEDYINSHHSDELDYDIISDKEICSKIDNFKKRHGYFPCIKDILDLFSGIPKRILNDRLFLLRAKGFISYEETDTVTFCLTAKGKFMVSDAFVFSEGIMTQKYTHV